MQMSTVRSLTLATAVIGLAAAPAVAAEPEAVTTRSADSYLAYAKQGLTYSELFDLEERFVDTVVYSMMDADESLIEYLFDIRSVRVSSDGQYATVGWRYDQAMAGTTLLADQGGVIVILAEHSDAMAQYTLEVMGVPPAAASEIAAY